MNLTPEQKETLEILKDQLVLPKYSTKISIVVMNSLMKMGLVKLIMTKRGEYWKPIDDENTIKYNN
jgi:hypothetical protein